MNLPPPTGATIPNLLASNNADMAALSQNGSTYLYHYSSSANPPAIRELIITGLPASVNNQESYNLSSPPVASPFLTTTTAPLYRPLAASTTAVQSLLPAQIYVFWADKTSGDAMVGGFAELQEIGRSVANSTWPAQGQELVPLGSDNSQPSRKRRLRRRREGGDWGMWWR